MAIGPPWQSTSTSARTSRAAAAHSSTSRDAVVERLRGLGADDPPVVRPMWHTMMSAPASVIARASSAVNTYGVVSRSAARAAAIIPPPGRSPCRSPRGWPGRPRRSARRSGSSGCRRSPRSVSSRRNRSVIMNGSVPLTPASTGVCLTTGSTSRGHLDDDLVGVAVGEQPGQRAAAGHPVPAGVVDDDEVDPAGLLALGRQARARAAADDRLARGAPSRWNRSTSSARRNLMPGPPLR